MSKYFVYKHTSPSGKVYIGITSQTPSARWRGGLGYRHNDYFFKAIVKYGWDNFKHEILFDNLTRQQACAAEIELIEAFNTTDERFGYNLTTGGEGCPGAEKTEDFRRGQSEKVKALWADPEYRAHMSRIHQKHVHSPEQRRKMREHHAGGVPARRVICLDTGKIYDSLTAAAMDTGACASPISKCCRGVTGFYTAGGFRWAFYDDKEVP